jgi:hypothetical protein
MNAKLSTLQSRDSFLKAYVVLYYEPVSPPANPPLAFVCQAEDADHAEEQCMNAYPTCCVAWVVASCSVSAAYNDYWASASS